VIIVVLTVLSAYLAQQVEFVYGGPYIADWVFGVAVAF
jgi:hypothetical protein